MLNLYQPSSMCLALVGQRGRPHFVVMKQATTGVALPSFRDILLRNAGLGWPVGWGNSTRGPVVKRIAALPSNWREFILCILMQGALPLVPLIFELIAKGEVSTASMMIGAAMYCIGIGLICQNKLIFGFSIFAIILLCYLHGISIMSGKHDNGYQWTGLICIILFAIAFISSKFNEHVMDNKPFWIFK